jgi:hypothetical protein
VSASELIIAGSTALATVGGGIAFVWNKVEKRFADIEAKLAECQAREEASNERRGVQLTVIELLWLELKRVAPDADVLGRAKKLLDDLKTRNREDRDSLPG